MKAHPDSTGRSGHRYTQQKDGGRGRNLQSAANRSVLGLGGSFGHFEGRRQQAEHDRLQGEGAQHDQSHARGRHQTQLAEALEINGGQGAEDQKSGTAGGEQSPGCVGRPLSGGLIPVGTFSPGL